VSTLDGEKRHIAVYVTAAAKRNDEASWAGRLGFIEFYKAQGFQIMSPEVDELPDGTPCRAVHLER
jgi:hypothetical protein